MAGLYRTIVAEVREEIGLLLETGNLPDELGNHGSSWRVKSYHELHCQTTYGYHSKKK